MLSSKYNRIAKLYRPLSYAVYGNRLLRIQELLLHQLPDEGNMLVLGGGDGRILRSIYQHRPHIVLDYVEASSSMLQLAKRNCPDQMQIRFILDRTAPTKIYDVVLLPFFLDQFTENELEYLRRSLAERIRPGGYLVLADFDRPTTLWHRILLVLTINFFRITVGHRPKTLPRIFEDWTHHGFNLLITKTLSKSFLRTSILTKT